MRRKATLLTMSPAALRLLAAKWFARGFMTSGQGFNGETVTDRSRKGTRSMLSAEFKKLYAEEERVKRARK